jgi:hypothetical protein
MVFTPIVSPHAESDVPGPDARSSALDPSTDVEGSMLAVYEPGAPPTLPVVPSWRSDGGTTSGGVVGGVVPLDPLDPLDPAPLDPLDPAPLDPLDPAPLDPLEPCPPDEPAPDPPDDPPLLPAPEPPELPSSPGTEATPPPQATKIGMARTNVKERRGDMPRCISKRRAAYFYGRSAIGARERTARRHSSVTAS